MGYKMNSAIGLAAGMLLLAGCPGATTIADGNGSSEGGGLGGDAAGHGATGGASSGGRGGSGGAGTGGSSTSCPKEMPAICRNCPDGSCGNPVCLNGTWALQCAGDPSPVDGGVGGSGGASSTDAGSGGVACNLACVQGRHCILVEPPCVMGATCPAMPTCVPDEPTGATCGGIAGLQCPSGQFCNFPESASCGAGDQSGTCAAILQICPAIYAPVCGCDDMTYASACGAAGASVSVASQGECGGTPGALTWYRTCGDSLCNGTGTSDDPSIPNCTTQKVGGACAKNGQLCDGVASCGVKLICAKSDPTKGVGGCPISRARFKKDISYLGEKELHAYHHQVMSMPLAAYNYKAMPGTGPQLGFIIEDIEPSVAVEGDHVNLYGYMSMAVAAIKVQQAQIDALQRELETLRSVAPNEIAAPMCAP